MLKINNNIFNYIHLSVYFLIRFCANPFISVFEFLSSEANVNVLKTFKTLLDTFSLLTIWI
jgi:hypothetical protein